MDARPPGEVRGRQSPGGFANKNTVVVVTCLIVLRSIAYHYGRTVAGTEVTGD